MIRDYRDGDAAAVRQCVIALQDHERAIDPRRPEGAAIADAYCERIHVRCRDAAGRVFVAEQDGAVAGFVAVLSREPYTDLDEPRGHYAVITDLVVLEPYRGTGIGRGLLLRAEVFAAEAGATELRLGVLAGNTAAEALYRTGGFAPQLQILAKPLTSPRADGPRPLPRTRASGRDAVP